MRSLDDLGQGTDVRRRQRQPGELQGEDLAEASVREEPVAGRAGFGLSDDAAPALASCGGHSRVQQEGAGTFAPLGRVDLQVQLGPVVFTVTGEKTQEGRPNGNRVGVGCEPGQAVTVRAAVRVSQRGDAERHDVSVEKGEISGPGLGC
jgi:hypothetical protein